MKRPHNPGNKAGKNPARNTKTSLQESKYESGGAKMKKKKGGVIRKPNPKVHYKHKKSVTE